MTVPYQLAIGPAQSAPIVTTRTNRCINPSFEVDTSSWINASATILSQDTTTALYGTKSLRVENVVGTVTAGARYFPSVLPSAVAGQSFTASSYVRVVLGPTRQHRMLIFWLNSSGGVISSTSGVLTSVSNASWTRISVTGVAPANTVSFYLDIYYTANDFSIGNVSLIDGVLLEQTNTLQPYFDGDTPDSGAIHSWTGTPNLSTSQASSSTVVINNTPTQPLSIFNSWTLSRNLDDGCALTIQMTGNSIAGVQMQELSTDIWVYESGVVVDRFRVVALDQGWGEDGENILSVQAVCYRRLLASRYVASPLTFSSVDQGDIVWGLIQHTQAQVNGGLGVTVGSTVTGVIRSRSYQTGQNILEAITGIGQADGNMIWDIDPNLQLNVTTAGSRPLKPMPAQLGTNLRNISKPSGASLFGNVALVTGDTAFTTVEIANASTLITDPRGRWERFASFSQEQTQSNLREQADGILESTQSPSIVWSFELIPDRYFMDSDYAIGDFVYLVQPATVVPSQPDPTIPYLTVPSNLVIVQILTVELVVDANGASTIKMTAVQSPQPWNAVPTTITWNDVDPSISWDDMLFTYLT